MSIHATDADASEPNGIGVNLPNPCRGKSPLPAEPDVMLTIWFTPSITASFMCRDDPVELLLGQESIVE